MLNTQASITWDEPIEMLYACHGKIQRFCAQLEKLPNYVQQNGLDEMLVRNIQQILTYFQVAAPLHHHDEEDDFFPLLLRYAPQAQATLDALESQHFVLTENWQKLSAQLNQLLAHERENVDEDCITQFVQSYASHMVLEEPMFELGKQVIPPESLREIGQIMAQRRRA